MKYYYFFNNRIIIQKSEKTSSSGRGVELLVWGLFRESSGVGREHGGFSA